MNSQNILKDTSTESIIQAIGIERDSINWSNIKSLMVAEQRIATFAHMLAERIAPNHRLATQIEHQQYFSYRKDSQMTQGDSERAAKIDAVALRENYEMVMYTYKATSDILISIRRRLKFYEGEKYEGSAKYS